MTWIAHLRSIISPTHNKLLLSTRPWGRAGHLEEVEPVHPLRPPTWPERLNKVTWLSSTWKLMTRFMGRGTKVLPGGRCNPTPAEMREAHPYPCSPLLPACCWMPSPVSPTIRWAHLTQLWWLNVGWSAVCLFWAWPIKTPNTPWYFLLPLNGWNKDGRPWDSQVVDWAWVPEGLSRELPPTQNCYMSLNSISSIFVRYL